MTITIKAKSVYGEMKYYPACNNASVFARIAGTKTLTAETIRYIKELGYEVIVTHEPVTL